MTLKKALENLNKENCLKIGYFIKQHANKGQISATILIDDKFEEPIFVEIDNYLVPFFVDVENSRFETVPAYIKLFNINTPEEIEKLKGKNIFMPVALFDNIDDVIIDFENFVIDYKLEVPKVGKIGTIINFIDDKKNPMFLVLSNTENEELLPLNAIEIVETNHTEKNIIINLPDSLLTQFTS